MKTLEKIQNSNLEEKLLNRLSMKNVQGAGNSTGAGEVCQPDLTGQLSIYIYTGDDYVEGIGMIYYNKKITDRLCDIQP